MKWYVLGLVLLVLPWQQGHHKHVVSASGELTDTPRHLRNRETGTEAVTLNPLTEQLHSFASDEALKHASWSFLMIDLENDTPLLAHEPQRALTPASIQKLITTASALITFGPAHRFYTKLLYDGTIDETGVLHGNICIRGSGDPSLGSSFWHDSLSYENVVSYWVEAIRSIGIRHITGNIVADDTLFDHEMVPRKWIWEDLGNYFGAGSAALSVNENAYTIFFRAGQSVGDKVTINTIEPAMPGMKFVNELTTGHRWSGDQVYIFGAPHVYERLLTGTVPLGASNFPVRGSMPDPALFLAQYLTDNLRLQGIAVDGNGISLHGILKNGQKHLTPAANIIPFGVWASPDLADIINRTNLSSVNVYAENLLKLIGLELSGEGTYQSGIESIMNKWSDLGMDVSGLKMNDGSGLSPSNRVTAEQIGFILSYMWKHPSFSVFRESLPLAGRSGSLAGAFRHTSSEGVLRAKSGFLNHVRSYAGYTTLRNGKEVAFVLIVNDYEGTPASMRDKMFRLMNALTEYQPVSTGK